MKEKPAKKKKTARRKVILSLSVRDYEKLTLLAQRQQVSRPLLARRMVRAQLAVAAIEQKSEAARNQLGLFDSVQIDIFEGTSKT